MAEAGVLIVIAATAVRGRRSTSTCVLRGLFPCATSTTLAAAHSPNRGVTQQKSNTMEELHSRRARPWPRHYSCQLRLCQAHHVCTEHQQDNTATATGQL
jgi:hypothetical protein